MTTQMNDAMLISSTSTNEATKTHNKPASPAALEALLVGYQEEKGVASLAFYRKAAMALPKEDIARTPTEISLCLDAGQKLAAAAKEDWPQLKGMPRLHEGMLAEFEGLREALWQASVEAFLSMSSARRRLLQEVADELRIVRQKLFGAIDWIWAEDTQMQATLDELKKGTGYVDLAQDGRALAHLFRSHAEEAGRLVAPAKLATEVEKAESLARRLMSLRNEPTDPSEQVQSFDLQQRIYTLFAQTYDLIAHAGRYLHEGRSPERAQAYVPLYTAYLRLRDTAPEAKTPPTPPTPPQI